MSLETIDALKTLVNETARRPPKCIVWDLDETLWRGTLAEGDAVELRPGVLETIKELDARGILHSIASRNDAAHAIGQLQRLGIEEFFLFPKVGWGSKGESIQRIAQELNIDPDSIVFIDDQEFERQEVSFVSPSVRCYGAECANLLLDALEARQMPVTEESRMRRSLYHSEQRRRSAEASFKGPSEAFLASLEMVVTIAPAQEEDLERAEELTLRTNQLNSTGQTYSREELSALRTSCDHQLLIVSLDDKYGSYGRIGVAVIQANSGVRLLKLLLMSCRVISRGTGAVVLYELMREARDAGARFLGHFVRTDRNRQMLIAFRFAGFREIAVEGQRQVLEHDLQAIPLRPAYVHVTRIGQAVLTP